jgi:signal peptidase I
MYVTKVVRQHNAATSPPTPGTTVGKNQQVSPSPDWHVYLVIAQRIAMAWGMVHVLTEYGVDITLCDGPSMMPTIQPSGEMLLLEKFSTKVKFYHGGSVKDGDTAHGRIQAARERQDQHIPKDVWHEPRLTIIPASRLDDPKKKNDQNRFWSLWRDAWQQVCSPLSVGDVVVTDHPSRPGTICKRLVALPGDQVIVSGRRLETVPDGHVWLEGDNTLLSNDSRFYGPLPLALIRGRAIARIWPLRGSAWLYRCRVASGSTVIPAGYRGEHIAKSKEELAIMREDR